MRGSKSVKLAYCGMCLDLIHHKHIEVIIEARKLAEIVVVGLLTDEAITAYKGAPFLCYEARKLIAENIKGVNYVVPQCTLDYTDNIRELRPDYVVHGVDWREGVQQATRMKVIEALKPWDGELVEIPYTLGISSTELRRIINKEF